MFPEGVAGYGKKKKKLEKQLEEQAKVLEEKERKEYERLKEKFENTNKKTTESMDLLGKKEMEILSTFDEFL